MSADLALPLIVERSRLPTELRDGYIVHRYTGRDSRSKRKEWWKTERPLGGGAYGTVSLQKRMAGATESTAEFRAVKILHKSEDLSSRVDWVRELETIIELSHHASQDYFVRSFGWYQTPKSLETAIVMEYLECGDLENFLSASPPLPELDAKDICFQLLEGLRFMHAKGFFHRDLKPANIMIKEKPPARWWVKIGDFGLSKRIETVRSLQRSAIRGTTAYMAPELQEAINDPDIVIINAKPADMWALGEILFRMITKTPVFQSSRLMWQYMDRLRGLPLETLRKSKCGSDGIEFFQGLMARAPADRFTADNAFLHNWMESLRIPPSPASSTTDSNGPELSMNEVQGLNNVNEFSNNSSSQAPKSEPSGIWTVNPPTTHKDSILKKNILESENAGDREAVRKAEVFAPHLKMESDSDMMIYASASMSSSVRKMSAVLIDPRNRPPIIRDAPVSDVRISEGESDESKFAFINPQESLSPGSDSSRIVENRQAVSRLPSKPAISMAPPIPPNHIMLWENLHGEILAPSWFVRGNFKCYAYTRDKKQSFSKSHLIYFENEDEYKRCLEYRSHDDIDCRMAIVERVESIVKSSKLWSFRFK